jgi:hypothetical protein
LKEKISSKNDIIRQQEKTVQEQKERLNDLNRKNLSLEENIGLLNQKRALLEREFNESKKQIQESAKLIQDNEKVSRAPQLLLITISPPPPLCLSVSGHQPSQRVAHRFPTWWNWSRNVHPKRCWSIPLLFYASHPLRWRWRVWDSSDHSLR